MFGSALRAQVSILVFDLLGACEDVAEVVLNDPVCWSRRVVFSSCRNKSIIVGVFADLSDIQVSLLPTVDRQVDGDKEKVRVTCRMQSAITGPGRLQTPRALIILKAKFTCITKANAEPSSLIE